ncbi:MAG: AAA family ATPase [Acidobacteria bacterium]|nr:AAA family ATPase [Acidobacteriota bacterium]
MKIIGLEVENVKRIKVLEITPTGDTVIIGGENAQGKSSVLDAIWMALGGTDAIPSDPIRHGATKAAIRLNLGEPKFDPKTGEPVPNPDGPYLSVERTFTAKGSYLKVKRADGAAVASPQALLDSLVGRLSFDPLAFARMPAKQQAETLRSLVGLDTTALDAERAALYADRTNVNRDLDRAKARAASQLTFADAPKAEVSVADLSKELSAAQEHNQKRTELATVVAIIKRAIETINGESARLVDAIKDAETRLADLKRQAGSFAVMLSAETTKLDKAEAAYVAVAEIPCQPIIAMVAAADSVNAKVRANAMAATLAAEVKANQQASDKLTDRLAAIDAEKQEKLASAKFPVAGLSFDAAGVVFNGVPFDQASDAEKLRVSVAIGMAANPTLRVIRIRDGSLLDEKSLAAIDEMVAKNDFQAWIERVGDKDKCAIILEDGMVRGTEGF